MTDRLRERELARMRRRLNQTETIDSELDDTDGLDALNVGSATGAATGEVRASDDIVGVRVGAGSSSLAPAAVIHAQAQAIGDEVQRLESEATNDNPMERVFQARGETTDGTTITLWSYTMDANTSILVEAWVVARRTAGAGAAQDSAGYVARALFKVTAGVAAVITPTIPGSGSSLDFEAESVAGWNCALNAAGGTARLRVSGAAGTTVTWHATVRMWQVST